MIGVAWHRDCAPSFSNRRAPEPSGGWHFIVAPNHRIATHARIDLANAGYHAFVFDRDSLAHARETWIQLKDATESKLPLKLRKRDADGSLP